MKADVQPAMWGVFFEDIKEKYPNIKLEECKKVHHLHKFFHFLPAIRFLVLC